MGSTMRLIFLGPPGAGKGTQAKTVCSKYGVAHVATGDILRSEVQAASPLGEKARRYMDDGALVPDELIIEMVGKRLEAEDCRNGFVFDGFPRTAAQAEALDGLLARRGERLDAVLYVDTDPERIVERLAGRRSCLRCGATFHVAHNPPPPRGVCPAGSGEPCQIVRRDDDEPEVIRKRLAAYEAQTAALIRRYEQQRLLRRIDGNGSIDEIRAAVDAVVAPLAG
jgi:adenylate kinase